MRLLFIILLVAQASCLRAAHYTNSTNYELWDSLSGGSVLVPGDTLWLRGGTYVPHTTNSYSNNELGWNVSVKGATNNLITIRGYPGEVARIDRKWTFGTDQTAFFLRFRDLWFFDSLKGYRNMLPIEGDPDQDGPWSHFDSPGGVSDENEWINCFFHDVHNLWSGGTSGRSIRGCVALNAGWTFLEHLVYELYGDFTDNIVGFQSGDSINLNTGGAVLVSGNIFFGVGQTTEGTLGGDIRLNNAGTIAWNSLYNRYGYDAVVSSIRMGSGIATNNVLAFNAVGIYAGVGGSPSISNNTFHLNGFVNYAQVYVVSFSGGINENHYTTDPGREVRFDKSGVTHTFAQWITNGVDTFGTATNAVYPPDSVLVYPNADEAMRANFAVWNWTQAPNVNVSLAGVLVAGDTYQLISGQNYGAGAIREGIYNGTSISVPMTNLSTAPILYGTNNNVFSENIVQAPPTSPEFGAFVVLGRKTTTAATLTANSVSIGGTP